MSSADIATTAVEFLNITLKSSFDTQRERGEHATWLLGDDKRIESGHLVTRNTGMASAITRLELTSAMVLACRREYFWSIRLREDVC